MGTHTDVLYGEQTRLTIQNMSFSGRVLCDYPDVVRAMAAVKRAAAKANCAGGLLDAPTAARIEAAAKQIENGEYLDQFLVDAFHGGGAIGLNSNVNEVIASLAEASASDEVNMSQSTNDVCSTAMHIAVYRAHRELCVELERVAETADRTGHRGAGIQTIARTCFQDGLPVGADRLFSALSSALRRQIVHIGDCAHALLTVRLGGTVIGSGAGAPEPYQRTIIEQLASVTGLDLVAAEDRYDATQYPDDIARLSAEVAIVCHILAKFAQDLRILSSGPECGIGELTLPAVQAGSSFFPGKINPVIPETVIQCDILVGGNDAAVQRCLAMGEGHLNLWEETMCFLLLDNMAMLTRVADLFERLCIDGVTFNADVCERYARSSIPQIVTIKQTQGYAEVSASINDVGMKEFLRQHHADKERQ